MKKRVSSNRNLVSMPPACGGLTGPGCRALVLFAALAHAQAQAEPKPPFPYVEATAYHVLPGTHNMESGYFSLCEGRDGRVYVGTAKYGENAYLVERWGELISA